MTWKHVFHIYNIKLKVRINDYIEHDPTLDKILYKHIIGNENYFKQIFKFL